MAFPNRIGGQHPAETLHSRPRDRPRASPRVVTSNPAESATCAAIDMVALVELAPATRHVPDLYETYVRKAGSGAVARLPFRGRDGGCARVACVRMTATESAEKPRKARAQRPQKAQTAQTQTCGIELLPSRRSSLRDACRRAARAGAAADRRARREARRGHPDHRCDRAEGVRLLSSPRRQGTDVAHLVPAQHAGRLADDHPAHGGAQRLEHRSGDGATGGEVSVDQPRPRA